MSNITFMVGNGFDLACGLKSRFLDTYDGYIKSTPLTQSDAIKQFKKTIEKDIPTWADFEMKLASYAKELKSESDLLACLRDYDAYLNDYLLEEQRNFWEENECLLNSSNAVIKEIGRSLSCFYEGLTNNDIEIITATIHQNAKIRFSFINFNYTDIFDRFVDKSFRSNEVAVHFPIACSSQGVVHIHGALGEDVTLGIDNVGQLPELPYELTTRGKRALLKPAFLNAFDRLRLEKAAKTLSDSDVICVFGMSLGESDATWRNMLATWLGEHSNHHLVYFKHQYMKLKYHSTAKTKRMDDEEDAKEELISLLFDEPLPEDAKEKLFKQIHIPVGLSIFNIRKAIDEVDQLEQSKNELKKKLSTAGSL